MSWLPRIYRIPPDTILSSNRQIPGVRTTLRPEMAVLVGTSKEVKIISILLEAFVVGSFESWVAQNYKVNIAESALQYTYIPTLLPVGTFKFN